MVSPVDLTIPEQLGNRIGAGESPATGGEWLEKLNPHDGSLTCQIPRSRVGDTVQAIAAARQAQAAWAATPAVQRGHVLHQVCNALEAEADAVARIVALETGKSVKDAKGEVGAAVQCGRFFAGEGQRLFGRTMPSGTPGKYNMTVRRPCGVAGLIIAANTPIANVAWKVFPALICGNAVVLKAAEDTPATAWAFARIAAAAGLPAGTLNVVHGLGAEAGEPLATETGVDVLSFTGSTAVGRRLAALCGERLRKVSLELGGKNPFVVCDDADLEHAVRWALLAAFSNAGQRCAAASRIIVMEGVYDRFRDMLVTATEALKVGNTDGDDLGPVINRRQLDRMLATVKKAVDDGATILTGGRRLDGPAHAAGCYMAPTLLEGAAPGAEVSCTELFGPIACLYRAASYAEAVRLANDSAYGLTACIHTTSVDRALHFAYAVQAGVAVVNAGTHGSEPHMPFGGIKASGNGSREPGTEALDVYSDLKDVYLNVDGAKL